MHILAPQPPRNDIPIFFNINSSVGHQGQNSKREDIMLVQFLIRKSAEKDSAGIKPDQRQRMLRVVADGQCGPITIDGIRAVQETMKERNPRTVVDGRVSPARGYIYGGGFWTIASLNTAFRKRYRQNWPRLQSIADCPGLLRAEAERCL